MGFSRQEYWSGLPFPSPGDLPNPGIETTSHTSVFCIGRQVLPPAPPGVGVEISRNWKFHHPLFGLWWLSSELSWRLWWVSFSLLVCYSEALWGSKSSGGWLVCHLGPICFSSLCVVSSGYVILSKVVPCPLPSCFREASMLAANFAWRKFQREAKLPFLLSFSLVKVELLWGCDFRDTKTPGNPRYLLADLKLSLMNHLFSPWGGEAGTEWNLCLFSRMNW